MNPPPFVTSAVALVFAAGGMILGTLIAEAPSSLKASPVSAVEQIGRGQIEAQHAAEVNAADVARRSAEIAAEEARLAAEKAKVDAAKAEMEAKDRARSEEVDHALAENGHGDCHFEDLGGYTAGDGRRYPVLAIFCPSGARVVGQGRG